MAGGLIFREARPGDAQAIAEVAVASRRWSYRDLLSEAELEALSLEEATADFTQGLAELSPGSVVFVAELAGRLVGYACYRAPKPMFPPGPLCSEACMSRKTLQVRKWLAS